MIQSVSHINREDQYHSSDVHGNDSSISRSAETWRYPNIYSSCKG